VDLEAPADASRIDRALVAYRARPVVSPRTAEPRRAVAEGLFELRTSLSSRREARVLFGVLAGQIRVVHAFMKKTRVTTAEDMALARQRLENWE